MISETVKLSFDEAGLSASKQAKTHPSYSRDPLRFVPGCVFSAIHLSAKTNEKKHLFVAMF